MVPFVNVMFSYSDYWRFFGGYLRVIISTFVVKILEDKLLSLEVPGERVGQRILRTATPAGDDLDHVGNQRTTLSKGRLWEIAIRYWCTGREFVQFVLLH